MLETAEVAEVLKDDKDSGLDILVFGADVNSDEACAQRSKKLAFKDILLVILIVHWCLTKLLMSLHVMFTAHVYAHFVRFCKLS